MKKFFLLLSLFLGISFGNAQGFGVQLGLNSAKLSGEQIITDGTTESFPIKSSAKSGLNMGLNYDFEISENLYVQPGLYFSQKGTKGDFVYPWGSIEKWDLRVNYLEIPVLIKYKFEINDDISILGLAGPSYNLGLSGELISIDNDDKPDTYDLDLINNYDDKDNDGNTYAWKKTYFGFQIGAGVMYQNFELKLMYTAGLSNASVIDKSSSNNSYYAYKEDFKQNVFSINLGYRFMD